VRDTVRTTLKAVPVTCITTLAVRVDALVPERLIAVTSGLFGGPELVVAAMGVFGLLACTVAWSFDAIG
jgi:hypothetical protein